MKQNNKRFAKEHQLALLAAIAKLPSDFIFFREYCHAKKNSYEIAELINGGIRWEEMIKYAGRAGILPIVAHNLCSNEEICIPEEPKQHLRWVLFMTTARNLRMYRVLANIISALQKEGIDVILLKGPVLAATVYPNIGTRAFGDLDLLVRKIDLPKVEGCFHTMNFSVPLEEQRPRELHKKHSFHLPFTDGKGSIIEIHWDFETTIRLSTKNSISDFWANAEKKSFELFDRGTITSQPFRVKVLSLEDALLVLCLHHVHHVLNFLGILSDIDKFVSFYKEKLNWEKFLLTAKKHALSRVAYASLSYAAELFDTDIPKKVLRQLEPKWYVKKILQSETCRALVLNETKGELGGMRDIIKVVLMERRGVLLKYLFRYVFPPSERLVALYSDWSVFIHHIVRPFHCLKKAVEVFFMPRWSRAIARGVER